MNERCLEVDTLVASVRRQRRMRFQWTVHHTHLMERVKIPQKLVVDSKCSYLIPMIFPGCRARFHIPTTTAHLQHRLLLLYHLPMASTRHLCKLTEGINVCPRSNIFVDIPEVLCEISLLKFIRTRGTRLWIVKQHFFIFCCIRARYSPLLFSPFIGSIWWSYFAVFTHRRVKHRTQV